MNRRRGATDRSDELPRHSSNGNGSTARLKLHTNRKRPYALIVSLLLAVFVFLLWNRKGSSKALRAKKDSVPASRPSAEATPKDCGNGASLRKWQSLVVQIAQLPPNKTLYHLEEFDPFGVRQFEEQLTAQEKSLGRVLTAAELVQLFPCPSCEHRITVPDQRDNAKAQSFREGRNFLFFQHLRKAGGTHFCSLAKKNLPKRSVPDYYCMPDYKWSDWDGAGYLHYWNNSEITKRMKEAGHRIAGNEWDEFDVEHHFELDAVFATSFRRPIDRALSQFRFECVEDRGCHFKNVTEWWENRKDLYNVYTHTFADPPERSRQLVDVYECRDTPESVARRGELIRTALDTVLKFNIVLVMEWLTYAGPQVQAILGFQDTSVLTERVRPHLGQAERNDGQDKNALGAASITKASWDPKEYLSPFQYQRMSEHLALDAILTDAARRIFLERLVCTDL